MTKDINFEIDDVTLNVRACAVIFSNDKILFQKRKKDEFWALPGGKVELMEKGQSAVLRELNEEIEVTNLEVERLLGVSENFFTYEEKRYHQYILLYLVNIPEDDPIRFREEFDGKEIEKNMLFKWMTLNELEYKDLKPDFLGKQLNDLFTESSKIRGLIRK